SGHGCNWVDPDVRVDRPGRRAHSVRFADDPGPLPRRLNTAAPSPMSPNTCRTNAAVTRLAADLTDPRNRAVAHRHYRYTHLRRRGRIQCLGVAHSVLVLFPARARHVRVRGSFC